jgi:DNA primase
VNKTNPYYLHFRCWGCGQHGSAKKFAELTKQNLDLIIDKMAIELKTYKFKRPLINWKERLELKPTFQEIGQLIKYLGNIGNGLDKFELGVNPYNRHYLIPMYNENGICGIQERWYENGECKKRCQRYSKHGWFRPERLPQNFTYIHNADLYICEGFSDTTVVIECGFNAIGRFNALHLDYLPTHLANWNNVIIIADTDKCGIKGAKKLQKLIPNSKIRIPFGYKDLRELYLDRGKEFTKCWLKGEIYL